MLLMHIQLHDMAAHDRHDRHDIHDIHDIHYRQYIQYMTYRTYVTYITYMTYITYITHITYITDSTDSTYSTYMTYITDITDTLHFLRFQSMTRHDMTLLHILTYGSCARMGRGRGQRRKKAELCTFMLLEVTNAYSGRCSPICLQG